MHSAANESKSELTAQKSLFKAAFIVPASAIMFIEERSRDHRERRQSIYLYKKTKLMNIIIGNQEDKVPIGMDTNDSKNESNVDK